MVDLFSDVVHLEQADSTNLVLSCMARDGAPEGRVVWADAQHAGRGRLGRTWYSPAGAGLYASFLLRPRFSETCWGVLSLMGGLAATEALRNGYGVDARLKWPNDVLVGGKKIGGVLGEVASLQPAAVVLGIGINLAPAPESCPPDVRACMTSLAALGCPAAAADLLGVLGRALQAKYRELALYGVTAVTRPCQELADGIGTELEVALGDGEIVRGIMRGIAASTGALRLEVAGVERNLVSGDVRNARFCLTPSGGNG